jgi:outer membrane protein OmpA-like peptidoglycan-associated protein
MRGQAAIVMLAAGLALLPGAAPAQAPPPGAVPAIDSLIDSLRPEAGQRRGIRVPAAPMPGPAVTTSPAPPAAGSLQATTAPPGVAAVSLTVTFATGSATLTPEAERVVAALAQALASPELVAFRFRVEGHTDTVGARALNQALSERRAASVRDALVQRHGIAPRRLEAIGLGEQQLLVVTPDDTAEPRNRRVQILNLGG